MFESQHNVRNSVVGRKKKTKFIAKAVFCFMKGKFWIKINQPLGILILGVLNFSILSVVLILILDILIGKYPKHIMQ